MPKPIRMSVGKVNYRKDNVSSEADAARALQASLSDIVGNLAEFIADLEGATPEILAEALEPTFGKAIEYCPKDTGALVDSGFLDVEDYRGEATVVVGFGRGGKPDYALVVHERTDLNHEAPTQAKFLERAFDEDYFSILNGIPRLISEYASA